MTLQIFYACSWDNGADIEINLSTFSPLFEWSAWKIAAHSLMENCFPFHGLTNSQT